MERHTFQDFLGRVPWRINGRILDLIREARQRGLAIGGIPPNEDPPARALVLLSLESKRRDLDEKNPAEQRAPTNKNQPNRIWVASRKHGN